MLDWAVGVLTFCLLLKTYKERKRMGLTVLIYLIILVIDLLVGGSLILWKCVLREDVEECRLAYGGTIGSVVIWLVVMLLCPVCMTKCSIFDVVHSVSGTIKHQLERIRPQKSRQLIETGLLLPSFDAKKGYKITALDENRNGNVADSEIAVIPGGRGTPRGFPDIVYTSESSNISNNATSLEVKCTEVDET